MCHQCAKPIGVQRRCSLGAAGWVRSFRRRRWEKPDLADRRVSCMSDLAADSASPAFCARVDGSNPIRETPGILFASYGCSTR